MRGLSYWVAEHPAIVGFRWSPAAAWGSTWVFLVSSIFFYLLSSIILHYSLSLLGRRNQPIPLGPVPTIHSLTMAVVSATIFVGLILSSYGEIRDTRWFWRRSKTPLQWLLCFPLGTRATGRVFFWSYVFYLSRFLHLLRTFLVILRRRRLTFCRLFGHSVQLCASFLWLEFSQSFQVLAILASTLAQTVVFGYRFWVSVGGAATQFPVVLTCKLILLVCNVACHVGFLLLHLVRKEGCNGIGAWVFNSVLNAAALLFFLNSYAKKAAAKGTFLIEDDAVSLHRRSSGSHSYELVKEKEKDQ